VQCFDRMGVGLLPKVNQSFWKVEFAEMPLLQTSNFNAIVGMGPPETPAADAWNFAKQDVEEILSYLERGDAVDTSLINSLGDTIQVATQISEHPPVLASFGVDAFSLCLGAESGSPGYLSWNDEHTGLASSVLSEVAVIGQHTWSVELTAPRLEKQNPSIQVTEDVECKNGCTALLDSGTSLLGVPHAVYQALEQEAMKLNPECTNMNELADLVFTLGGKRVSLPPSSYVAEVVGKVPSHLSSLLRVKSSTKKEPPTLEHPRCQLFAVELNSVSDVGATWILGVPFFRKYYTRFKVGRTKKHRKVLIARADADCKPATDQMVLASTREAIQKPIRIELSKLYMPERAREVASQDFINL